MIDSNRPLQIFNGGFQKAAGISVAPDASLWISRLEPNALDRVAPNGASTSFPSPYGPSSCGFPAALADAPEGSAWFTDPGSPCPGEFRQGHVGRISEKGAIASFPTPGYPTDIAQGPEGNAWFLILPRRFESPDAFYLPRAYAIGRATPGGRVSVFGSPELVNGIAIAAGPDGNLWYTERNGIGAFAPGLPEIHVDTSKAKVRGRRLSVFVSCAAGAAGTRCAGRLSLWPVSSRKATLRRLAPAVGYRVPTGRRQRLSLRLTRGAANSLRRRGKLSVKATAAALKGLGAERTVKLTLRRPAG